MEPTLATTFSLYGTTAYDVQYWTGSAWATVPQGSVTNNNLVWWKFSFTPLSTSKIKVVVTAGADNVYSRLVEIEAYAGSAGAAEVNWLVTDHRARRAWWLNRRVLWPGVVGMIIYHLVRN